MAWLPFQKVEKQNKNKLGRDSSSYTTVPNFEESTPVVDFDQ